MNRRTMLQLTSRALVGAGTASLLPNCATTGGMAAGALPPATKVDPFVNSLGMKFVPVPGTNILMCTTETTVSQYQAMGRGYQSPWFTQGKSHPAVNVSREDAKAWCEWLGKKEGRQYRLPLFEEWSAAVGSNTYPWGAEWPPPNNSGNYAGQELREATPTELTKLRAGGMNKNFALIGGFRDRHKFTAPVGSYSANTLGIYDLGGNAQEWCEERDPSFTSYGRLRGSEYFGHSPTATKSSDHQIRIPSERIEVAGFRCVIR